MDTTYVNYVNTNVPCTYDKAMHVNKAREWKLAIDRKIECLKKNNTEVGRQAGPKKSHVKWVFSQEKMVYTKREEFFKDINSTNTWKMNDPRSIVCKR